MFAHCSHTVRTLFAQCSHNVRTMFAEFAQVRTSSHRSQILTMFAQVRTCSRKFAWCSQVRTMFAQVRTMFADMFAQVRASSHKFARWCANYSHKFAHCSHSSHRFAHVNMRYLQVSVVLRFSSILATKSHRSFGRPLWQSNGGSPSSRQGAESGNSIIPNTQKKLRPIRRAPALSHGRTRSALHSIPSMR